MQSSSVEDWGGQEGFIEPTLEEQHLPTTAVNYWAGNHGRTDIQMWIVKLMTLQE